MTLRGLAVCLDKSVKTFEVGKECLTMQTPVALLQITHSTKTYMISVNTCANRDNKLQYLSALTFWYAVWYHVTLSIHVTTYIALFRTQPSAKLLMISNTCGEMTAEYYENTVKIVWETLKD